MNLFFDSSALLKRYLNEKGDVETRKLFDISDKIFVSATTHIECASTFQRLLQTKLIDKKECQRLNIELSIDFPFFETIHFDDDIKHIALKVLEKHTLKALDTIQLATLIYVAEEIDSFVVCDNKLKKYAKEEGFKVIDPTE
jgi:uncharacterized protein